MIQVPRGTKDLLPGEVEKWQYIEKIGRELCKIYGYREIRTPIFEYTELFLQGIGETTDIVQKEMYTFEDRGGRSITLRPEGTAPVVRAYLEHCLFNQPQPVKLYYLGPMFRYDRPQTGRFRQFHQFGFECFGSHDPAIDAEVICLTWEFLRAIGLTGLQVELNSIGCPVCRPHFTEALRNFFIPYKEILCSFCQERLERNPLRLLDCKLSRCRDVGKEAPTVLAYLCDDCQDHFSRVQSYLKVLGVPYLVNPKLARGLDYYTHTAFEVTFTGLGAQNSLAGGGRYNNLVESCGGPSVPGIGVAVGLERVLLALRKSEIEISPPEQKLIFIATTGEGLSDALHQEALCLLAELRRAGFCAEKDYLGRRLKAQMKHAGKLQTRFVVILGQEELAQGKVVLRDMDQGTQREIRREELFYFLSKVKDEEEKQWKV